MNGPYKVEKLSDLGGAWINITSGISNEQSAIKSARSSQAVQQGCTVRVVDGRGCLVAMF